MCHLNLKPENILIENEMNIKVCGFGSSLKMTWVQRKISSIFPTIDKSISDPYCVAPELLKISREKVKPRHTLASEERKTEEEEDKVNVEK